MMIFTDKTYEQLLLLGVSARYVGCRYAACAVKLCTETPDRLLLVTKWLYPDVARRFQTNWTAVERDLRTVSRTAWKHNRPLLEDMIHRPLPAPPTVTELLYALCYAVANTSAM